MAASDWGTRSHRPCGRRSAVPNRYTPRLDLDDGAPGDRLAPPARDQALDGKHAEPVDEAAAPEQEGVELPYLIGALAGAAGIALDADVEDVPERFAGLGHQATAEELGHSHQEPGIFATTRPSASSPRPR